MSDKMEGQRWKVQNSAAAKQAAALRVGNYLLSLSAFMLR